MALPVKWAICVETYQDYVGSICSKISQNFTFSLNLKSLQFDKEIKYVELYCKAAIFLPCISSGINSILLNG